MKVFLPRQPPGFQSLFYGCTEQVLPKSTLSAPKSALAANHWVDMTRFSMLGEKVDLTTPPSNDSSLPCSTASDHSGRPVTSNSLLKSSQKQYAEESKGADAVHGSQTVIQESEQEASISASEPSLGPSHTLENVSPLPLPSIHSNHSAQKATQGLHHQQFDSGCPKASSKPRFPSQPPDFAIQCRNHRILFNYRVLKLILIGAVFVSSLAMICCTVVSVTHIESRQAVTEARYRMHSEAHNATGGNKQEDLGEILALKRQLAEKEVIIRRLENDKVLMSTERERLMALYKKELTQLRSEHEARVNDLNAEITLKQDAINRLESSETRLEQDLARLIEDAKRFLKYEAINMARGLFPRSETPEVNPQDQAQNVHAKPHHGYGRQHHHAKPHHRHGHK